MRAIFLLALASALQAAPCGGHADRATMLVTPQWLADHLRDPNLVILAVGKPEEFAAGHIPGSHFFDYRSIVVNAPPNAFEFPPIADVAATFAKAGVSNASHVVLYTTKDYISPTTRVYLTLDAIGLGARTSLLNGGYVAWEAEKRPVTTEVRDAKPGALTPCAKDDVIVDAAHVKANLRKPGVALIDARTPNFYTGASTGRPDQRPGHIPGALNLPYLTLVDDIGKFPAAADLQQKFRDAGLKPGDRVVTYCHVGQTATVVWFAARYLGLDARLYDGSYEDWSRRSELAVEK